MNETLLQFLIYVIGDMLVVIIVYWLVVLLEHWGVRLPKFFPSLLKPAIIKATPIYYDLTGKEIPRPKRLQSSDVQDFDFQADTTALILPTLAPVPLCTVSNPTHQGTLPAPTINKDISEPIQETAAKPPSTQKVYCVKCRRKQAINNVDFMEMDTRRGIKRYMQGQCNKCGSNVSVLVKRVV